ncbi:MAG: UbiA family prenyltransferase [Isosphaeraceae bacterium]|nr:UbiA family prenyltransferase [Isosphaeraceae bacterium]
MFSSPSSASRPGKMAIKPYLQLVRLPNVFTAAADSLAGWLLVGGALSDARHWLPLAFSSMAIYAAGIALNDVFDYEVDRLERPGRPLPSGRVSRRFAWWLGATLLAAGPLVALASGSLTSAAVAALLAGCVLAYDAGAKRTWLGPSVMGACRGLNVLLGMSQAPALGGPTAWLVAGSMSVFVMGVTWISRGETGFGRTRGLYVGMVLENLAILGLVGAALRPRDFPSPAIDRPILNLEGLLVLLVVAWLVALAGSRAIREPRPEHFQKAVKTGVLSLVWLNCGVVAAVRGVEPGLAIAAFWVPAYVLGRWIYST